MNKEETRQHVRDTETANAAIKAARENKYDPPISTMDTILPGGMSDSKLHDHEVYNAAYKEARKNQ